jgi:hypothetical protein
MPPELSGFPDGCKEREAMLQFPLPQLHKIVLFPNVSRTLLGI